jgi:hypothetical protein
VCAVASHSAKIFSVRFCMQAEPLSGVHSKATIEARVCLGRATTQPGISSVVLQILRLGKCCPPPPDC